MNKKEAQEKWHVSKSYMDKYCEIMNIPKNGAIYKIDDDARPLFIPLKNVYKKNKILYVIDAIVERKVIIPEQVGLSSNEIIEFLQKLKDSNFINNKQIPSSLSDVSLNDEVCSKEQWRKNSAKRKMKIIKEYTGIAANAVVVITPIVQGICRLILR